MSEMDILCGEKNIPPHTQQSQMATEFTSSATKENTMSIITSEPVNIDAALPTDGGTDTSGLHDETMSSLCPNNSNSSLGAGAGAGATAGGPVSKNKRKHRRGKPKTKNIKPYKKANWKFQVPSYRKSQSVGYGRGGSGGGGGGSGGSGMGSGNPSSISGRRIKLNRSRSLVPYNTNKFLMEEHLAEVPSALLTPSDEEEFLTKEFANVYEKARVERLETLSKQQLIEECLQIEDRYSEQGAQRQQQINAQRLSAEYLIRIRSLEEKVRDLTKENIDLRRQLTVTQRPTPMDSSSEDSESDSSSSSGKSSSSSKSSLSTYSSPGELKNDIQMGDPSLSAEEHQEIANGVSNCNGYHSANSNTPSSSPSRPSSPTSPQQSRRQLDSPASQSTDP
ncbi:MAP7 domain-containing protein 2 isoform X2 [Eupeodes corollae]|uniref:MAP7 domain-containing protein 2 isoform X2 n=1 Tax=Eupeodes corollae TaxID=290404 RepID=UPI00249084D6|nr:MAP7 domain-containing protein 2 isoform X2 [Eupeodes corollae]